MKEIIYYTDFSDNQIFQDPQLNIFCNQLYTFLINKVGLDLVRENLLIDGSVALYLQDEEIGKVYTVKFSTFHKELFGVLKASVTCLNISSFTYSDDLVTMRVNNAIVEVALLNKPALVVDYQGMKLLSKNQISKP